MCTPAVSLEMQQTIVIFLENIQTRLNAHKL